MTELEILDEVLRVLRKAVTELLSPDYIRKLRKEPDEVRNKWAMTTFRLDEICDDLEKAQLKDILKKLKKNEAGLIDGAKSVRAAIQTMEQIKQTLDTLAQFAEIAARIVAL